MREIEINVPVGRRLRADEVKKTVARQFKLSRNAVIRVIDPTQTPFCTGRSAEAPTCSAENAPQSGLPSPLNVCSGLVAPSASATCVIRHRSLDARGNAVQRYSVEVYGPTEKYEPYRLPEYKDVHDARPVIVVGAGPAGMFAALKLLTLGLKPIVLERGRDVHSRKVDMAALSREGVLDPDSNYCFGEGGAGAFSDGKLFTRSSKRGDNREVLYQLVRFGASPDILIDAHPHIGSDKLPAVVENIRRCVESYGGEYHFNSKVVDIRSAEAGISSAENAPEIPLPSPLSSSPVVVTTADGREFCGEAVILATGHSARDVYEMAAAKGWELEAKGFALGVRVEHPQSVINDARYHGKFAPGMPAAEYSFVEQVDGRGVFSFCMCPGGILVPSSTEEETVVLNGMSNSARNSRWANAGVVVSIEPSDVPAEYAGDGPFALLNFQRDIERSMYNAVSSASGRSAEAPSCSAENAPQSGLPSPLPAGSHPFAAPGQRMTDFCRGKMSYSLPESSYHPGVVPVALHKVLPPMVATRLQKVFPLIDKKIPGYYSDDALLLGVESRTSSPVRIPRDPQTLQCARAPRVFPCGEGAGYSGGIVSSAIDGIRCAAAAAEALCGGQFCE